MSRFVRRPPTWIPRFHLAIAGIVDAVRTQRNFVIHLAAALAVIATAAQLRVGRREWCLLVLCVTVVLVAELFNTALEHLARAITEEENDRLRRALDIASGAVLTAAVGAATVGAVIFLHRLGQLGFGWPV
ncbi:MAG: diacylglycerol kinase family protein [Planctomycetota bacterium]|nr:MAG: diacylglycerol kinase family protein [Planctomycetota bacterium]